MPEIHPVMAFPTDPHPDQLTISCLANKKKRREFKKPVRLVREGRLLCSKKSLCSFPITSFGERNIEFPDLSCQGHTVEAERLGCSILVVVAIMHRQPDHLNLLPLEVHGGRIPGLSGFRP
jgi:hypothetical protein